MQGGIFKNCAPLTDYISEICNTQINNAKYIDVKAMYNLIEYSNNYSKTLGSVCGNITKMIQIIIQHNLNHLNTRLK